MLYYIQNKRAGYTGNSIMFWAKGNVGYTAKLEGAEKYTYEQAKEICEGNPDKNKAWLVNYIDNNEGTARVTDSQYLELENIIDFSKSKEYTQSPIADKKLYYTVDNGGTKTTASLSACMQIIEAESPIDGNSIDNENQWTLTPVWLTEEEFNNLPEE